MCLPELPQALADPLLATAKLCELSAWQLRRPEAQDLELATAEQLQALTNTVAGSMKFKQEPFEWVYAGFKPLLLPSVVNTRCALVLAHVASCITNVLQHWLLCAKATACLALITVLHAVTGVVACRKGMSVSLTVLLLSIMRRLGVTATIRYIESGARLHSRPAWSVQSRGVSSTAIGACGFDGPLLHMQTCLSVTVLMHSSDLDERMDVQPRLTCPSWATLGSLRRRRLRPGYCCAAVTSTTHVRSHSCNRPTMWHLAQSQKTVMSSLG
jgi:hypothetical protein